MDRAAVLEQFATLNVWSRGDQRAPHKPLLALYALARWAQGDQADIPFRDADPVLTALLKEFGPFRKSYHSEYPFWRLQRDGVWNVHATGPLVARKGNTDPRKSDLLAHDARGGFTPDVQAALLADPTLIPEIAVRLLENHFPESLHGDILAAVGLDLNYAWKKDRKRDPRFRQRVLTAYEWRCAVCGFDVRLGTLSVGLDAAHIRWHQAGGPDEERNGLALCVLHHKTFDLGVFTVNDAGLLLVSDQAHGGVGFDEMVMRHHGNRVRAPQRPEWKPETAFLDWHGREVFKGEARHLGETRG